MPQDHVPGAVLHVDEQHVITECNDRCQVILETDREDITGETLSALADRGLFDGETLQTWKSAVERVRDGNTDAYSEGITITPNQNAAHAYRLQVQESVDGQSDAEVYCSLSSVGTDQRYDDTLTALHAATRDLMTAENREAVLREAAVAASEVLGFPGTAVRVYDPDADVLRHVSFGSRVGDIDERPPYPVEDSPHGVAFRRNETVVDDIDDDDDPYDREVFTQTMYIPIGRTGLLSVGTVGQEFDETDVRFAEILAENAAAAIRVVETTTSLRQERERLDRLKQVLTRVLRHNIRNNVNVVQGNLDLLTAQLDGGVGPIDEARTATEDIVELSEKARQLARIVDSPRSRNPVDLVGVVESAITRVRQTHPDLTVERDLDQCRVVAHDTLGLAVENLIENAAEHTRAEEPSVAVSTTVDDGRVTLVVADDGPGIPQEEIEVIESEDETELWHGSGLGLWIVKLVVDRCEATVDFEPGPDGSRVSLSLPCANGTDG